MWQWIKRWFCKHEYMTVSFSPNGYMTLDWGMVPTREYDYKKLCRKCGHRVSSIQIVLGDKKLYPGAYDASGWPIGCDIREG